MTGKVSPSQGGCWYCHTEAAPMLFSREWDSYVHAECIKRALAKDPNDAEARVFAEEFDMTDSIDPRRAALEAEFDPKTGHHTICASKCTCPRRNLAAAESREALIAEKDAEIERLREALEAVAGDYWIEGECTHREFLGRSAKQIAADTLAMKESS